MRLIQYCEDRTLILDVLEKMKGDEKLQSQDIAIFSRLKLGLGSSNFVIHSSEKNSLNAKFKRLIIRSDDRDFKEKAKVLLSST